MEKTLRMSSLRELASWPVCLLVGLWLFVLPLALQLLPLALPPLQQVEELAAEVERLRTENRRLRQENEMWNREGSYCDQEKRAAEGTPWPKNEALFQTHTGQPGHREAGDR